MSLNGKKSAQSLKKKLGKNYKEFMAKKRRGKSKKKVIHTPLA